MAVISLLDGDGVIDPGSLAGERFEDAHEA
jgi:hypothetical protein